MKNSSRRKTFLIMFVSIIMVGGLVPGQERAPLAESPVLKTPLPPEILNLLANEVSGQIIFNNLVRLAGAPWLRDEKELTDTFYESGKIYELVRGYGIQTTKLDRYKSSGTFEYPVKGEFWTLLPVKRLIARLEADAALVSRSSADVDITGGLVYIPPLDKDKIKLLTEGGPQDKTNGKIALMWNHANRETAKALDAAGIKGVITFAAQERYFDPDQVLYSGGTYAGFTNLKFGFTISWRQWAELLEDLERGTPITVQAKTKLNKYPDRFEFVFSSIPGTEPDKKGVIFTAHLFEGYTKRGANDNMSGCVVQLEILRAFSKLIAEGTLPKPRRTIYFLWPNEISGTYEFIKQNPGFPDKLSIDINMDMVGEALRKNNGIFTMSECPNHLPSYLDGLADSIMNYVWRTNDIVYLNDSPRGRIGGQYFPRPMWEKNGSKDAFRYFTHQATGGSDHVCFNNAMVAVPGIEFFTWPDQWYHTDTDTPDKADPTEMKRVAFIGAATAWAAANCTDEMLPGLLDAVASFGFARVGKRELPAAYRSINAADAKTLAAAVNRAVNLAQFACGREAEAVTSIQDIYSGFSPAGELVNNYKTQWEMYGKSLSSQILAYGRLRAEQLKVADPQLSAPDKLEKQYANVVPSLHPDVKGKEFSMESSDRYKKFLEKNPEALKGLNFDMGQRRFVLNYINGKRSVVKIRSSVGAETGRDVDFNALIRYLEFLKAVGWIVY